MLQALRTWLGIQTFQNGSYIAALHDIGTGALLAVSKNLSTIIFLSQSIPESTYRHNVASLLNNAILNRTAPEDYPLWLWDAHSRTYVPTRTDLLNDEIRARSRLAIQKEVVIGSIMFNINRARDALRMGLDFQDRIYLTKKFEAQRFKDNGYPEEHVLEYSYVMQYADYRNIPLMQAANEILFKAKMADDILAKTELLRMQYFNRVKHATALEELPVIYEEFTRDCYRNAHI